jgi:hypothetical protein
MRAGRVELRPAQQQRRMARHLPVIGGEVGKLHGDAAVGEGVAIAAVQIAFNRQPCGQYDVMGR